jgi:two-component SAPR family response regulator
MKELMSSWNYDVHVCDDENKIGEIVKSKFIPDILIVDYQLNNRRTGVQFVEKFIRKINKKIPAIFVTANFSKRVKFKIDKLNYELLYKPVKPAKLRTTIETIIRNNNTN